MKTKYLILLFVVLSLLSSSCDSSVKHDEEILEIRIENASAFDMDSVLVGFPQQQVFYGNISSGDFSDYEPVSEAIRYAYVETKINGELCMILPFDDVGEKRLEPGSYTYVLTAYEYNIWERNLIKYRLSIELRED